MADVVTLPVIRIERQNDDTAFVVTDAMVEAVARARCKREGNSPDHPVYYEGDRSGRYLRNPIKEDLIGTKRHNGSIIEQWPTMPLWRWAYERGVRADLELASAHTSQPRGSEAE